MGVLYWEVSLWRGFELLYRATFLTDWEAARDHDRLARMYGKENVSLLAVSAL